MSIRSKSLIIFLSLSLIPLFLIGAIGYQTGKEAIKNGLGSSYQRIAHEAIDKADRSLYEVFNNVKTWAELELMQDVITGDMDGKISSFLMGLSKEYRYFSGIEVIHGEGEVVASSHPKFIGSSYRKEPFFEAGMEGRSTMQDVHFNPEDQTWIVQFTFPIKAKYEEGKILGVISAKSDVDQFFKLNQVVDSFGRTREKGADGNDVELILIRGDGLIISSSEFGEEGVFKTNLNDLGLRTPPLASRKKEGYLIEEGPFHRTSLIGYDFSGGYRDFSGFGWGALAFEDVDTAFAPIERLKFTVFGVGAGVAFLVALISIVVSKKMTSPIVKISDIAARVSRGDFQGRVDYDSKDEIGTLTESFNRMITDLDKNRRDLVSLKDYLRNVLDQTPALIIATDTEFKIVELNRAVQTVLGYNPQTLPGRPLGQFWDDPDLWAAYLKTLKEGKSILNQESPFRHLDGSYVFLSYSMSPMVERGGRVRGAIFIATDISSRKQLENLLLQSERRAAFSYFTSTVIHDIRTPLIGIRNALLLLKSQREHSFSTGEIQVVGGLVKGTELLLGIVNDRLDIYQGKYVNLSMKYSVFRLSECLSEVIHLLMPELHRKCIRIDVENGEPGLEITADKRRLQRVFINLLDNAIKYSPQGGRILIAIETRMHCGIPLVEFKVKDEGPGVSEEMVDKIFLSKFGLDSKDPQAPGRGLGLEFCRVVVQAHGGEIWAETHSTSGATFGFYFPLKEAHDVHQSPRR